MKTYAIKTNRTAADVVKNNDETLENVYSLEEAQIASIQYQQTREEGRMKKGGCLNHRPSSSTLPKRGR